MDAGMADDIVVDMMVDMMGDMVVDMVVMDDVDYNSTDLWNRNQIKRRKYQFLKFTIQKKMNKICLLENQ